MFLGGVLAGVSFFKKNCILVSFYLDLSRNDVMVLVLVSSMAFMEKERKWVRIFRFLTATVSKAR